LSTTNPTWPDPASNPGCRRGTPATNRLSYGTAPRNMLSHVQICQYEKFKLCISFAMPSASFFMQGPVIADNTIHHVISAAVFWVIWSFSNWTNSGQCQMNQGSDPDIWHATVWWNHNQRGNANSRHSW
jgi:hypothetical protein